MLRNILSPSLSSEPSVANVNEGQASSLTCTHNYRPPTNLWESNVFTGVGQSFCSQGVGMGISGPMSFPGGGYSPHGPGILRDTGCTHPTGMLSSLGM